MPRKHRNQLDRLTAPERVEAFFADVDGGVAMGPTSRAYLRPRLVAMLKAHAAATLDRAARRRGRS